MICWLEEEVDEWKTMIRLLGEKEPGNIDVQEDVDDWKTMIRLLGEKDPGTIDVREDVCWGRQNPFQDWQQFQSDNQPVVILLKSLNSLQFIIILFILISGPMPADAQDAP